jgi:hypothetical protein
MLLNKRFMPAAKPIKAGLFIIATERHKADSTGRRNTPF